jgi:hypothetical protein
MPIINHAEMPQPPLASVSSEQELMVIYGFTTLLQKMQQPQLTRLCSFIVCE